MGTQDVKISRVITTLDFFAYHLLPYLKTRDKKEVISSAL
jgi:hypothetical protein